MRCAEVAFTRWRAAVRAPLLNLCVALWMLGALNVPFWAALWQATGGWTGERAPWLLTLPVVVLTWVWLALELLTWGRAARPVMCGLLVAGAVLAYFMHRYGVVFDRGMLVNVLETDLGEVRELLSPTFVVWVAALGVLPAAVVWRTVPRPRGLRGALFDKAVVVTLLLLVLAAAFTAFFSSYASLFRNHRELRLQLVPTNLLAAVYGQVRARLATSAELEPAASDAARVPAAERPGRPLVVVLVVGETARAANLSLNGYARATTPLLAARPDLVNFGAARACGTATAVALPCMFLDVGREGYADGLAYRRESLLDALQRAGLDVWWLDNNSGCKGVCDRVPVIDAARQPLAVDCPADGCLDEVLLDLLDERLAAVTRDTVIVLHLKGQHGPAYYRRYPPPFERFAPVCNTNELDRCEPDTVVNAYDNALGYTDHVVDWAITSLEVRRDRFDAALLFVSDHGESLGERGLYLHGLPYDLAPAQQKEVPFVAWLPAATSERAGVSRDCLQGRTGTLSHDNLYHSVMGLAGVRARTYREPADVFAQCRLSSARVGSRGSRHDAVPFTTGASARHPPHPSLNRLEKS